MLLATHQQLIVARQAASATRSARRWHFLVPKCINYSLLKTKAGASDGQAGDDGNVKTLTVSIDTPQAIAQSNLPCDLTPWLTGYRRIPPEALWPLFHRLKSRCERAGDINALLECGL